MSPLRTVVAVVIAACVADCAGDRAQIANYAQNKMVGLTKEAVLIETARILGLTVPSSLLATVDEVIE